MDKRGTGGILTDYQNKSCRKNTPEALLMHRRQYWKF
jgi:hypothetical protein